MLPHGTSETNSKGVSFFSRTIRTCLAYGFLVEDFESVGTPASVLCIHRHVCDLGSSQLLADGVALRSLSIVLRCPLFFGTL
jgi:hypothetical protein